MADFVYTPFYVAWHNRDVAEDTPINDLALTHFDAGIGGAVAQANAALQLADQVLDLLNTDVLRQPSGATPGWVPTVASDGNSFVLAAPTDVSPLVAAAVDAYLAANPVGNVTVSAGTLTLPGTNGSYVQCPDAAGLRIAGDLDVRLELNLANLNNGTNQTLVAKQLPSLTGWLLRQNSNGKLSLQVSADGTTLVTATASANTPITTKVRFIRRKSDGVVRFFVPWSGARVVTDGVTQTGASARTITSATANFTSDDVGRIVYGPGIPDGTTIQSINSATSVHTSANSTIAASGVKIAIGAALADGTKWANVGTDQAASLSGADMYTGTTLPLTIGAVGNGTAVPAAGTTVNKVEIRSGIDLPDGTLVGTLVASPDFTNHDLADVSFIDAQSNTWSVVGTAAISPKSGTMTRNGLTITPATLATVVKLAGGWGWARPNPITGCFHPENFGPANVDPATWTVAQTGAAVRAARAAAALWVSLSGATGATVKFGARVYEVDADPAITDPVSGLAFCAIRSYDYVTFDGAGPDATTIKLTAGANCHVFGGPGRLAGDGSQDKIFNVSIRNLTIDGNRTGQDGARNHDLVHLTQHPGLRLHNVRLNNGDGKGYYSTALGEFGTGGANLVAPVFITDCEANNNAQWGFFCSATNRHTTYKGIRVTGNGSPQARIAGKTVAANIAANGNLILAVDDASSTTIALTAGDTPATVASKVTTALAGQTKTPAVTFTASTDTVAFLSAHGMGVGTPIVFSSLSGGTGITAGTTYYVHQVLSTTSVTLTTTSNGGGSTLDITADGTGTATYGKPTATLTQSGRLLITSGIFGGVSKVYLQTTSTAGVLTNLGYTITPLNGDNTFRCGSNEYGGIFLDHSECHATHITADSNFGDGIYIHNVNACHYLSFHSTRNTGYGINVDALNHSSASSWYAAMNCTDFGAASYRTATITAELYFDNGTEGYGVTKDSTLLMFNGPGDKTTIGSGADNRRAAYAIVIANGVGADLDIAYAKYGDGGLTGNLLDQR